MQALVAPVEKYVLKIREMRLVQRFKIYLKKNTGSAFTMMKTAMISAIKISLESQQRDMAFLTI